MANDRTMLASYRRGFARAGSEQVTFKRVEGFAPNAVTITATVSAIVRLYTPDIAEPRQLGYSTSRVGGISEGDRLIIVMAADLAAQKFPLPLRKNDKAILSSNGDELNVVAVDASKRSAAGAIEVKAAGVA